MSKGILSVIEGAAEVAAGLAVFALWGPMGAPFVFNSLIMAGIGTVLSGIGTLIEGHAVNGIATATRNSIAPWRVCYGRARRGGAIVHVDDTL